MIEEGEDVLKGLDGYASREVMWAVICLWNEMVINITRSQILKIAEE